MKTVKTGVLIDSTRFIESRARTLIRRAAADTDHDTTAKAKTVLAEVQDQAETLLFMRGLGMNRLPRDNPTAQRVTELYAAIVELQQTFDAPS